MLALLRVSTLVGCTVDPPAGVQAGRRCVWVQVSLGPAPATPTPRSLLTDGFDEGTCWVGAALGFSLLNSSRRRTERKSMARKFPAAPDDTSTGSPPLSAKLMFFLFVFFVPAAFPVRVEGRGRGMLTEDSEWAAEGV